MDYHKHMELSNMVTSMIEYEWIQYDTKVIQSDNPKRFHKYNRSSITKKVGTPQARKTNSTITDNKHIFPNTFHEPFNTRKS